MILKRIDELATNRNVAIGRIESYSELIFEHLIKILVYGNMSNNLDHWITEISTWLTHISSMKIKTKTGKLKTQEYYDLLFGSIGEDEHDITVMLKFMQTELCVKKSYPKFEITVELVNEVYAVLTNLGDKVSFMLADKRTYSSIAFSNVIREQLREVTSK